MKRKILVPMFASMMALSMNTVANADEVQNNNVDKNENTADKELKIGEYKDSTYKKAAIKDGVAVKVREEGSVQHVAYTGDEFKVLGTQGDWVKVDLGEESQGWLPTRYVDIKEADGFITGEKVNLRKEANTESEVLEELTIGAKLTVLEQQEEWVKVKDGDKEGFVSKLYIADKAPVIEVEEKVEEKVEEATTQESASTTTTSSNNNRPSNNNTSNNRPANNRPSNNTKPKEEVKEDKAPQASSSSAVQAVLNLAYSKIGSPYVWGSEGPNSFDCSGLTSYVFRNAAGVSLPRTSRAQAGYGATVSKANLQPGDLVFFNTSGSGVSHVGIYVGGGQMVHSPNEGQTVHVASINSSYYASRFVTAKRVL